MPRRLKDVPDEVQILFDSFDVFAAVPNGVKKLRELILQLAVQGKLVPQDPNDEPASVLLKKIKAGKARHVAEGKIKKQKPLPPIDPDEVPFEVPEGWEWVRFGDAMSNRDGERIPVSRAGRQHRQGPYDYYGASGVIDKIDGFLFDKPLLLIGEDGANLINRSTPIAFIARGKYWVNNHAHVLDGLTTDYLRYIEVYINATDLRPYITGTAQPKMNQAKMNSIIVALPPEREQNAIVAKVDQLMSLCDELEAKYNAQQDQRQKLNAASLDTLLAAKDQTEFDAAWQRVCDTFNLLYDAPESVIKLRQAILQLAVMGKLVEQDPNDEPASKLLKKIKIEKDRLFAEGKIKKPKILPPVGEDERHFGVSESWEWVRIGTIADQRLGKMLDKAKNKGEFYPYLRNINVQWLRFDLSDIKEMRFESDELAEFRVREGDLLVCEGGEPGRCAIWDGQVETIMFQKAIHRLRPYNNIDPWFLLYCLWGDAKAGGLDKYFTGATIKHFTGQQLSRYSFALPPLPEQHRIVAKVDQLMSLCDDLEVKLTGAREGAERLVGAVVGGVG